MRTAHANPFFELGSLTVSPKARATLTIDEILRAVARHAQGDWRTLTSEKRQANQEALARGGLIVSEYEDADGINPFHVITEASRASTTVRLAAE